MNHSRKISSSISVAETVDSTTVDEIHLHEESKKITIKKTIVRKSISKVRIIPVKKVATTEEAVIENPRNTYKRNSTGMNTPIRCGSARSDHPFAINFEEQKKEPDRKSVV